MSIPYLGDFAEQQTVWVPFNTFSSSAPISSVTVTTLTDTDVYIYRDDFTIQYTSAADVDVQIDFDSIVGSHLVEIRTTNSFFEKGANYHVRIVGATVDGGTINAWIGCFSIENRFSQVPSMFEGELIGTPTSTTMQSTSFFAADAQAYVGGDITFLSNNVTGQTGKVKSYNPGTNTITITEVSAAPPAGTNFFFKYPTSQ